MTRYATDAARWEAVRSRDKAADGQFVYAVRSTGVYCQPSCPSRPARPENVCFYPDCAAAEAAGFRPCLRCKPQAGSQLAQQAAVVARACRLLDAAETEPTLAALASACDFSPYHFHRLFKQHTGLTPKAYYKGRRAARVQQELGQAASVTAAIYEAGYQSSGRFYAEAAGHLGMSPRRFRAGGSGEQIHFAIAQCSLGALLVAATAKGICAILLGDEPEPLLRDLQDRFPKAELRGAEPDFEATVAAVVGLVEAPRQGLDLPLDVRGTAFQQRVWQALRAIPPGQTVSYAELAERVGIKDGARAVAGACAANALAVAIPCHRVVRNDGALSGYRWGVARKEALLVREGSR
ncbi:bifunctional DNA-binding transcriptional regulator/O6-methylguanine-DNA methyltransferase Ada [Massilia sp. TS11]|uniref:bifunctional DNA-binding transcriptional regulator/O6-methylguanine-DNA methyltransferase Ada n=1 Tax=Massilia sp. TS11 TaxID=2908003 RepID=UPI001EDC4D23|nr:bifunctional DNA-binding transcriptional regulator/O6-methylguanine-DNA methyltransferase Ada [Massilia sp. TS11]MCG2586296.1 bifunctional DNA-binding transcriptional regulator/O6-methylguanine-DNA methyltransferase Ada [Massilia sp. TS11]